MKVRASILVTLAAVALATPALAYYHFVYYLSPGAARAKFDLSALPNKTVYFFVPETGPTSYSTYDGFPSVIAQIRQAVQTWNSVSSSDLRVAFGGFENAGTTQNTPAADVVFEDLPPGLLGYGGPTVTLSPVTPTGSSPWVPIARSAIHLNINETIAPGPSYNESFFLTVVHEMGHALGLQHTFTSSAMSTATTRSTSMLNPIDADDVAGISALYPAANFFSSTGSISGRITTGGNGVNVESVVAIRAGSPAISALTNPDGTYEIDGVAPGQYIVYAHALPPDADIRGPWLADGTVAPAGGPTTALFYPGTTDPLSATSVTVAAGKTSSGVDIEVASLGSLPVYDVAVYSFFGSNAVKPGYLDVQGQSVVSASGFGLGANGMAPGLSASFIGSQVTLTSPALPYQASGYTYIGWDVLPNPLAQAGPQHLVFNSSGFVHVLPAAIRLTTRNPPTVQLGSTRSDGSVTVTGTNWTSGSRICFDGLPAIVSSLTIDPKTSAGTAVVSPPAGVAGQTAIVAVFNPDGQNSRFFSGAAPTYVYPKLPVTTIASISPSVLPAGAEAVVDITTSGFSLSDGLTSVGFGSSDILVQRVFVLGSNHVQVDVAVAPGAALAQTDISVFSGFQMATAPSAFRIVGPRQNLPSAYPNLVNALPGLNGAYAGAIASIYGSNLSAGTAASVVTFNGEAATILYSSPNQINLVIPSDLSPGIAVMTVGTSLSTSYPVNVVIDSQPATITSVLNSAGTKIGAAAPAAQGDLLTVHLSGFAADGSTIDASRVQVGIGSAMHSAVAVSQAGPDDWQVVFQLDPAEPIGGNQQLVVYLDGRSSYPVTIPIVAGPSVIASASR